MVPQNPRVVGQWENYPNTWRTQAYYLQMKLGIREMKGYAASDRNKTQILNFGF